MPYASKEKRHQYQRMYRETRLPREYVNWRAMKVRCTDPNVDGFDKYGGRGITVCDRWLNSFDAFLEDMGPKPTPKHSIDRIDPQLGYFKENCRWATVREQIDNRTDRIRIVFNGEVRFIESVAGQLGIKTGTLYNRITRLKWDIAKALCTPLRKSAKAAISQ